jgi:hypothetical protein
VLSAVLFGRSVISAALLYSRNAEGVRRDVRGETRIVSEQGHCPIHT